MGHSREALAGHPDLEPLARRAPRRQAPVVRAPPPRGWQRLARAASPYTRRPQRWQRVHQARWPRAIQRRYEAVAPRTVPRSRPLSGIRRNAGAIRLPPEPSRTRLAVRLCSARLSTLDFLFSIVRYPLLASAAQLRAPVGATPASPAGEAVTGFVDRAASHCRSSTFHFLLSTFSAQRLAVRVSDMPRRVHHQDLRSALCSKDRFDHCRSVAREDHVVPPPLHDFRDDDCDEPLGFAAATLRTCASSGVMNSRYVDGSVTSVTG